jgi:dynein light chain 1
LLLHRPAIKKLDPAAFAKLQNCEHLALSTNNIDKLDSFGQLPKLRILSLGRNLLKKLAKLEDVAGTLEELWLSYNQLKTLDDINVCENLEVLYFGNNYISDWEELKKLGSLPKFRDILLVGNPIYEGLEEEQQRLQVLRHLPNLTKIDGKMVTPAERAAAKA